MRIAKTERFDEAYIKLIAEERKAAQKAIRLLQNSLRHPSLQVKRIQGTSNLWEARVTIRCRLTFQIDGDIIVLRNIGEHDATLKNP